MRPRADGARTLQGRSVQLSVQSASGQVCDKWHSHKLLLHTAGIIRRLTDGLKICRAEIAILKLFAAEQFLMFYFFFFFVLQKVTFALFANATVNFAEFPQLILESESKLKHAPGSD